MELSYINELRYSYHVGSFRRPATAAYEAATPETAFEYTVQSLYVEGQRYLHHREYHLALDAFRELLALILRTAHPLMPIDPNLLYDFQFPRDPSLLDTFFARAADILKALPVPKFNLPDTIISPESVLPPEVLQEIGGLVNSGIQITSYHGVVDQRVGAALAAVEQEHWEGALRNYREALEAVPDSDRVLKGSLLHDVAVLFEKAGNRDAAQEFAARSVESFSDSAQFDAQVQALNMASGIMQRAGNTDGAKQFAEQAAQIVSTNNVNAVTSLPVLATNLTGNLGTLSGVTLAGTTLAGVNLAGANLAGALNVARPINFRRFNAGDFANLGPIARLRPLGDVVPAGADAPAAAERATTATAAAGIPDAAAPELMALRFVKPEAIVKTFTMTGTAQAAAIVLDNDASGNVKGFLETIAQSTDVSLLTRYLFNPVQMVAYLPHMYFFVIPMAVGDCLAGMGNLQQAADQYASVLSYPFINQSVEIVKLWTQLARTYLDQGDAAYRQALDDPAQFGAARAFYRAIVLDDNTIDAGSPLYANGQFAGIRTRVTNFLAAADPAAHPDNPAITLIVLQAQSRLQQIAAGLNFFGFGPDYTPPFSFEYLQNTARYFAQQASQMEQRYIQFQSQAENEELRREQLDQQAEVARQSVVLEQRGVAEAQRGIAVAQASRDYAQVELDNAVQSKDDFEATRWELLELTEAEAWANASSVDRDDQVQLSWHGTYYNSDHRRRNQVLQDLAYQRGRLSQELESNKLDRAINSAAAYVGVTDAQIGQAQARLAVAQQRVVVAQLQQRYAEENRDFLDMREFGAQLWYELAAQARAISLRYLDRATEIAFLMQRAYNAETDRGLQVIRYDYQPTAAGNLMGSDLLLQDIDYFTYDHITTTKTKKIPVKKTISLADSYPMQFHALKAAGKALFETALEDFDREYPGFYLAKIRNVELIFVGITQANSIAGTLRNIGVSRFRNAAGEVVERLYPADVMALSQYDIRQDALAFRFNPNDLRLFENNGVATFWQLELPASANDFDYNEILDVHLVLYYDGFFDPQLEAQVRGALPAGGSASRAFSLRMSFPDEFYYLKNQGEAELAFDATMFPRNQRDLMRRTTTIKVTGQPVAVQGLNLQLVAGSLGATTLKLTTDANGEVLDSIAGSALQSLQGRPMFDDWTLRITAEDNPQLVQGGALDLSPIADVLIFSEYDFVYR